MPFWHHTHTLFHGVALQFFSHNNDISVGRLLALGGIRTHVQPFKNPNTSTSNGTQAECSQWSTPASKSLVYNTYQALSILPRGNREEIRTSASTNFAKLRQLEGSSMNYILHVSHYLAQTENTANKTVFEQSFFL